MPPYDTAFPYSKDSRANRQNRPGVAAVFLLVKLVQAALLPGIVLAFGVAAFAAETPPPMPRPRPDIAAQPEPPPVAPGQESDRQKLIKQGFPGGEDGDALMPPTDSPADLAKLGTAPRPVTLVAEVTEKGARIGGGLTWRVFASAPDKNGNLAMIAKSSEASPTINLPPGNYLVHVAYGEAQASDTLDVRGTPSQKTMILDVGGLRLNAAISGDTPIPPSLLHFDVFTTGATQAERTLVAGKVKAGDILTLNAGIYHVISYFGDVNATERADLRVQPGQLTDATLYQKAAQVSFKLVTQSGGEAIADVDWSVKSRTGSQVFAQTGSYPSIVLEAGDYTVSAKRAGKVYSKDFTVAPGKQMDIDVVTGGT
jgi:hypothetical protein